MAVTNLQLHQDTLLTIGEPTNSEIGAQTSGTDPTDTTTTQQFNTKQFNYALDQIAETCFFFKTDGTLTFTGSTDRTKAVSAATGLSTGVRLARIAWDVRWNGAVLRWCDYERVVDWDYAWRSTSFGLPMYWFHPDSDKTQIALYPPPMTTGTVTITGAGYPTLLSADTDAVPLLSDNYTRALVYYAAAKLCEKAQDDPDRAKMIPYYMGLYDALRVQMLADQPDSLKEFLQTLPTGAVAGSTKRRNVEGDNS